MQRFDRVIVEKFEHYQKQSYRNRCYINTATGVRPLIIPLVHPGGKSLIHEVRIDYSQKWLNNHWRTIVSAYGKAPFFEYYQQELQKALFRKHVYLYDLNMEILAMCLKWLRYNIQVGETTSYERDAGIGINDFRSVLNPKKADSCNSFFKSVKYQQVFGSKFVDNLSIVDLIFCEGPAATTIIRSSALEMNK
jgi:hypothetical protein